jgi:repressor LexA
MGFLSILPMTLICSEVGSGAWFEKWRPIRWTRQKRLQTKHQYVKKKRKKRIDAALSFAYFDAMKQTNLTKRQQAVLHYVHKFLEEEGRSPTLKEIAEGVGSSAVSTIHKHVQHLIEKGFLGRSHGAASPERISGKLYPFCGDVAAGAPLIPESRAIPLEVPNSIHRDRDGLFVLRVRGDSMIQDCIMDGDLVVLQRRGEYRNGDRVVALIDGEEATLKEFRKDPKGVWLIPHNPELTPKCFPPEQVAIQGVLVGVMRSC